MGQADATGIGRYGRELVRALAEACGEEQLALVSTPEPGATPWVPQRVELRVAPWPRRPVQAAWCLGVGPRIERAIGRLDVIHLLHVFPPARTAAPVVVTVHDTFPLDRPEWYPRSERWTYRRGLALAIARAARIVVPSRYVADRLAVRSAVDPARISVVPQGISGAFASAVADEDVEAACRRLGVEPGAFAVSLGAVTTRKNLLPLVRAMGRRAGLPLVLIGSDGYGAAAIDDEIASLNGGARVIRTGYLPDREAAALVSAAVALVHPALGEGFGFVPLEAMAAGTPVIAARTSSVPEVAGDAAVLVDEPTDPDAWAAALRELTADERRRAALVAAGQRRAAAFSWRRTATAMLEVYRDVGGV